MRPLPLVQFALHHDAAGDLCFRFQGAGVSGESITSSLRGLFGPHQRIKVLGPVDLERKLVQYTSEQSDAKP